MLFRPGSIAGWLARHLRHPKYLKDESEYDSRLAGQEHWAHTIAPALPGLFPTKQPPRAYPLSRDNGRRLDPIAARVRLSLPLTVCAAGHLAVALSKSRDKDIQYNCIGY